MTHLVRLEVHVTYAVVWRIVPGQQRVAPVHAQPRVARQDAARLVQVDVQQRQSHLASRLLAVVRRTRVLVIILKQVLSQSINVGLVLFCKKNKI